MTTAHLIPLLGVGCAASSLIAWLAAIHPSGYAIARFVYVAIAVLLLFGLVFDDAIYPALKMPQNSYYGMIGAIFLVVMLGGLLVWLSH